MMNDRCLEMQKNKHGQKRSNPADFKSPSDNIIRREWRAKCWSSDLHLQRNEKRHQTQRRNGDAVLPRRRVLLGFESLMAMRDEVLVKVRDVEQLLQHGRETHACPYYSTRMAIPAAQVHTHLMQHTLAQIQPCAYSLSLSFSGGGVAVSVAAPCFHPQSVRDQTKGSDCHYRWGS